MYDMMKQQNFGIEIELTVSPANRQHRLLQIILEQNRAMPEPTTIPTPRPTGRDASGKPCKMAVSI